MRIIDESGEDHLYPRSRLLAWTMESRSRPFKGCRMDRQAAREHRETSAMPRDALGTGRNPLRKPHVTLGWVEKHPLTFDKVLATFNKVQLTCQKVPTTFQKVHAILRKVHTTLRKVQTTLQKVQATFQKVSTTF